MKAEELLKANKNLSKNLTKAHKKISELWNIKERYDDLLEDYEHLENTLAIKQKVSRVIVKINGDNYILEITRVEDTPNGIFIEGGINN